jgi:hypothetical protein
MQLFKSLVTDFIKCILQRIRNIVIVDIVPSRGYLLNHPNIDDVAMIQFFKDVEFVLEEVSLLLVTILYSVANKHLLSLFVIHSQFVDLSEWESIRMHLDYQIFMHYYLLSV